MIDASVTGANLTLSRSLSPVILNEVKDLSVTAGKRSFGCGLRITGWCCGLRTTTKQK
jgi:hypothetical protein